MQNDFPDSMTDFYEVGDRFMVTLPDGSQREVVVLATYKGGSVDIDFVSEMTLRLASIRASRARGDA